MQLPILKVRRMAFALARVIARHLPAAASAEA
jgi:hypothetical protein